MHIAFIAMSGVRCRERGARWRWASRCRASSSAARSIASLPSLGLLTLAGLTPDPTSRSATTRSPDIRGARRACRPYDVVAISSYSAQIKEAYALADRYRAAGRHGGPRRPARHRAAGRGARARRCDRHRRGRDGWPRAAAPTSRAARLRRRLRRPRPASSTSPMRRCRASTCSTSSATTGSPSRPARLPVPLRVLRRVHPAHHALQGEAGREGHRRDPRDQAALAAPVHRVRRRQHFVDRGHCKELLRALAPRANPLVHRDRHLHRRRPGTAGPDARGRLRRGPHRTRKPACRRRGRHRARAGTGS